MKKRLLVSICSYGLPHLKAGCMRSWEQILESRGFNVADLRNKTENTYQVGESVVEFFGIEGNLPRAQGTRRDVLFINECNRNITGDVYKSLADRSGLVFLDYNPWLAGWVQDLMKNFPDTFELIHSTYKDNPFLSDIERREIEKYRDKPEYENYWRVYGLGELGSLAGAILPNWTYGEFDTSLPVAYGLDFGFRDQDAMVKVALDTKRQIIYGDEKIFKSGNSTDQLRQLIAFHCSAKDLIVADCANPRTIDELKRYFNIKPVSKGKGSVAETLKVMQDYRIVITEDSRNLEKELNNYCWHDKRSGIPIDAFNHLIDGIRYVFMHFVSARQISHQRWYLR